MEDVVPRLVDVADEDHDDAAPVPVTVVTGYLGSGKSTLLQHLATHSPLKIAVVLNEFGNTSDIERSLVVESSDAPGVAQWVELDNGCMCCTAKAAGVAAIEKLVLGSLRQGKRIDHVVVETSGVADPAKVAGMFWLDSALMAKVRLNGVVAVVDARTFAQSYAESSHAGVQVACADLVLLNKCDTVPESELARVEALVTSTNGAAPVLRCQYGRVDPRSIFELDAYAPQVSRHIASACSDAGEHSLSTVTVDFGGLAGALDLAGFERKLQHVLWERELDGQPLEVHRTKGRLQLPGQTKIVQGVRDVYEIVDVAHDPGADFKLVLIGKNVKELESALQAYFVE